MFPWYCFLFLTMIHTIYKNNGYTTVYPSMVSYPTMLLLNAAIELKHIPEYKKVFLQQYLESEICKTNTIKCLAYSPKDLLYDTQVRTYLTQMFDYANNPIGKYKLLNLLQLMQVNLDQELLFFDKEYLLLEKILNSANPQFGYSV